MSLRGWGATTAPAAAATSITPAIPSAAGSLTTATGTATPLVGDLCVIEVGMNTTAGTWTLPTATSAGSAISTLGSTSSNGLRTALLKFTVASGDLSSGTVAFSWSSSAQYGVRMSFWSSAGTETVATPTGGTGNPTFPASGTPSITGDSVTWFAFGKGAPVAAVQTVTINGAPTGGTFTLTYSGQTTSALAYNATAATVQTALQALSTGAGITVSGSAGGPYTVTFPYAAGPVTAITASSSLTGGTSPSVSVAQTTTGSATSTSWASASPTVASVRTGTGLGSSPIMLSAAEDAATLTTTSQVGATGVTANATSGYAGYAVMFKASSSAAPVATAPSAATVNCGTSTNPTYTTSAATATVTSPDTGVTWAARIIPSSWTSTGGLNDSASTYPSPSVTAGSTSSAPTVGLPIFGGTFQVGWTPTGNVSGLVGAEVTTTYTVVPQKPTLALSVGGTAASSATVDVGATLTVVATVTDPQGQVVGWAQSGVADSGSPAGSSATTSSTGGHTTPTVTTFTYTIPSSGGFTTAGSYGYTFQPENLDEGLTSSPYALPTAVHFPVTVQAVPTVTINAISTVDVHAGPVTLHPTATATGSGLSYAWTVAGPGSPTLTGASTSTPTLVIHTNKGGTYTVSLTVTDNTGAAVSATPVSFGAQAVCIARKIDGQICYQQVKLT